VTPGVLVEMSNLAGPSTKENYLELIMDNLEILRKFTEIYVPKNELLALEENHKFGFTDTSLLVAAQNDGLEIISEDRPLIGKSRTMGLTAFHLDEIITEKKFMVS